MPRHRTTLVLIFLFAIHFGTILPAAEPAFTPPPINVPDGFVVEPAAMPPLVKFPMMAGFDDRGRLFVAEAAGKNLHRADLEKELPNFIRMLEDTDGDGRFDRSTIFADRMTFPMGALWLDGALYVASPPNIWRLEDTDGDGVADKRRAIVTKFGYSGNGASVHGCFLGPAGRLYWCDGRHGHQIKTSGGSTSKGKAARIFSCRPDGSDVRVHCGGGMDNPVEVVFTPEGEMLGTVDLLYRKRGDCLVHWMHGGVYPRYDQPDILTEFYKTGDPLTEVLNLGHIAISGLARYRGTGFGAGYRDNLFITEFNTHKMVRTILTRQGSTFTARAEEFLTSTSDDFHPTDVLEDADGSLLVIDTGGWFRIGCPTSQIAKPNILGGIYRIRKAGNTTPVDPRGLKLDWAKASPKQLTEWLGDERFAVRERAIQALARRGDSAVGAISAVLKSNSPRARRDGIWALARMDSSRARAALREMLADKDTSVRQAAVYSAGINRDEAAADSLLAMVTQDDPPVRREAATALGRIGSKSSVPALLVGMRGELDRMLEHALIYALIEIDDRAATIAGLSDESPAVRRGALIALDQMPSGRLTRQLVAPLLDSDDFALQSTALEIIGRRPGWADEINALLRDWLAQQEVPAERLGSLRGALLAFRQDKMVQSLVRDTLARAETSTAVRLLLLEVIARSHLKPLPAGWAEQLRAHLAASDGQLVRQAVAAVGAVEIMELDGPLLGIARDAGRQAALRLAALAVVAGHGRKLAASDFQLLAGQLDEDVTPTQRLTAAGAIGMAALDPAQLVRTAELVTTAGPLELSPLLAAFEKTTDPRIGTLLVSALKKSPGLTSLSGERLSKLLQSYPEEVTKAAAPLVKKLSVDLEQQQAHLAELEPYLDGGDAARGKEMFFGKRTACSTCHTIAGQGGNVGPDLSKIGQSRSRRDLLEAILYPSSSLARGFQTYAIATEAGRIHTGVITRETTEAIHLRSTQQSELRIPRSEIEEMVPSRISVMPQGLEQSMTNGDLGDLVAFLRSLK